MLLVGMRYTYHRTGIVPKQNVRNNVRYYFIGIRHLRINNHYIGRHHKRQLIFCITFGRC